MEVFILEVVEGNDPLARRKIVGVYADQSKSMDGRRGPWREWGENGPDSWTTMNDKHGSAWLHPTTGVARKKLYFVRKTQMIG